MSGIKTGYYESKTKEDEVVRAVYFPSFNKEVVIENFRGVMKCWKVKDFLSKFTKTNKKFSIKLERVKDGQGMGSSGF